MSFLGNGLHEIKLAKNYQIETYKSYLQTCYKNINRLLYLLI
jgi:hypothetical protein